MAAVTASRLALYEGMIALAWADHELHAEEKQRLHDLIDHNSFFSDAQRAELHRMVDVKVDLALIWPRITHPQDRARLIDIANAIFASDGERCDMEQMLQSEMLSQHLSTLDVSAIRSDLDTLSQEQRAQREADAEELRNYAREFSLVSLIGKQFDGSRRRASGS